MEYEKIMNLLENIPNQPSKFRTKYWVEINDDEPRRNNSSSQTNFKNSMLKSDLCDYSDANILLKGTTTVWNTAATAEATNTVNEKVILKRCVLFTDCISQINNTQTDNAKIWMLLSWYIIQ